MKISKEVLQNPRAQTVLLPRGVAALGITLLLVMAGSTSSVTAADQNPHDGETLQVRVLEALAASGAQVPADAQGLLAPDALEVMAAYFTQRLQEHPDAGTSGLADLVEQALHDVPVLAEYASLHEGLEDELEALRDALVSPKGMCIFGAEGVPVPEVGLLAGPLCLIMMILSPAITIASLVLGLVAPYAVEATMLALEVDQDANEMGDYWTDYWERVIEENLTKVTDLDQDGLNNLYEFRWELYPFCSTDLPDNPYTNFANESLFTSENCKDYEYDNWEDGPEVEYWNNELNDGYLSGGGVALYDPDRLMDLDNDTIRNTYDPDSDNDGFLDGDEISIYGTYPEFADSDCVASAVACTAPEDTWYWDPARQGQPGTGDGLSDSAELAYWNDVGPSAWTTDYDGDGISNNLLDGDADGDTLLDSEEFTIWFTKPHHVDSDLDGLRDDEEVRTYHTNPNHWDTDGDLMPDRWEVENHLNPLVNDGTQDADSDGLNNRGEYRYDRPSTWDETTQGQWDNGTDPNNPDTEGDGLFDGPEVLTHRTNPFWWDTDYDKMPDAWEAEHGLNPRTNDASGDPDGDFFDQGSDGTIEQTWTNLQEYNYGKTAWNEASQGPWNSGTDPRDPDTDDDGAKDGQEVYFGEDPTLAANVESDSDQDGLTWSEEAALGTNPSSPDTDGDGLCDGGRAANCFRPGGGGAGNQPGEADYGSTPWITDSDGDGLGDATEALRWDPSASGEAVDADGDFLNGVIDADNDDDGLLDGDEVSRGTDPALRDTDSDGLTDGEEAHLYGTNPKLPDHDGDGLLDGNEIHEFHTGPLVWDTDDDGLSDGAEILQHGTDPLLSDTDGDGMDDGWEVGSGTQPRADDSSLDSDNDGLSNTYEYQLGSDPNDADTDGDGMPDGWEDRHDTAVLTASHIGDLDSDDATNLEEYEAGTDPNDPDTDGDGLNDGGEFDEGTDPLAQDSDLDGLLDGGEVHVHGTDPASADPDGEGLNDFDEVGAGTDPYDPDTDDDGLSDFQEVFGFGGRYKPNDPDSDDDGVKDGDEVALADPQGDVDNDGLTNSQESTYGTNPSQADSDCDGIEDGGEVSYWSGRYGPSTFKPYLLNPDVDGDGIKDGIEIGPTGTGSHVLYRTEPDRVDTEGDGLWDGSEAQNNFKPGCAQQPASASASWGLAGLGAGSTLLSPPGTEGNPLIGHAGTPLPEPVVGASLASVATDADELARLAVGFLYEDPASGLLYGVDWNGLYVQGGYGVRLYIDLDALPDFGDVSVDLSDVLGPQAMNHESGIPCTNPWLKDTDEDGLTDPEELSGSKNPYKAQRHDSGGPGGNTDPCSKHSDGDGINDGLELGVTESGGTLANASIMNPNHIDTDGDGLNDDVEDADQDGVSDLSYDSLTGVYTARGGGAAISSPVDADTDDDGLPDGLIGEMKDPDPLKWDLDGDGLSDGLEMGVTKPVVVDGITHTVSQNVLDIGWPTFQEFKGTFVGTETDGSACKAPSATCDPVTTDVNLRDSDGDGIIDGLEDVNHNGKFGDFNSVLGVKELGPNVADSDNDGILDGKELLIYGTYTFQSFVQARGNPWTGVTYDEHIFKTDPLLPSTDTDDILDGKDIDPKGDGLLLLQLDTFWQYDEIDVWNGNHATDLVLKVTMETGVGDFWLQTTKLQDFGSKDGSPFSGSGIKVDERKNPPSVTGATLDTIKMLDDVDDTIRFDLPDNIDDFVKARDLKVHVRLDAIDIDGSSGDEFVDVSSIKGATQFYDTTGVDLSAGPLAGGHQVPLDANGNGDSVKGDQNDGRLKMNLHSNLTPYFLRNILGTQVMTGNCLGGVTEINQPCLQ